MQDTIFKILSSNAPPELVIFVVQSQGNVFNSFHDNGTKNFSTRNHPQIACKVSPVPIRLCVNVKEFLRGQMDKTKDDNVPTPKLGLACTSNQSLEYFPTLGFATTPPPVKIYVAKEE